MWVRWRSSAGPTIGKSELENTTCIQITPGLPHSAPWIYTHRPFHPPKPTPASPTAACGIRFCSDKLTPQRNRNCRGSCTGKWKESKRGWGTENAESLFCQISLFPPKRGDRRYEEAGIKDSSHIVLRGVVDIPSLLSAQFSSVAQSCPTLCDAMNRSTPGLPVHRQLPVTQTHAHRVGDAIQPSHPLSSPSPPAP